MMRSSSLTKPFDDEVLLEGVESLVHLVKMRASQINGCAYCLDLHSKDARALGETEQRLSSSAHERTSTNRR
jgi:AhpD family alkylhydroperoxidase